MAATALYGGGTQGSAEQAAAAAASKPKHKCGHEYYKGPYFTTYYMDVDGSSKIVGEEYCGFIGDNFIGSNLHWQQEDGPFYGKFWCCRCSSMRYWRP